MDAPAAGSYLRQRDKRGRLAEDVTGALTEWIVEGKLRPGDRVPSEPKLMDEFNVGRSTVREAVRVLASRGLVEIRQGVGTFVTDARPSETLAQRLRHANAVEVYQVRNMLEVNIATLAAQHRSDTDVAELAVALEECAHAFTTGSRDEIVETDVAFHLRIARASGNVVLADLYAEFLQVIRPAYTAAMNLPESDTHEIDRFHRELYRAIKARQPDQAAKVVHDSIAALTERLEAVTAG